MKKILVVGVVASVVATAGFMDSMASQMGNMMQNATSPAQSTGANATQGSAQLVSQLTQALNVNPKQAIGGTAALMALASSKMPKDSYNSLLSSVPGLASMLGGNNSPVGNIMSMVGGAGVDGAFKALGMDNSMVSKFAPALLGLFKQYTDDKTLGVLSQAWSAFLPKK